LDTKEPILTSIPIILPENSIFIVLDIVFRKPNKEEKGSRKTIDSLYKCDDDTVCEVKILVNEMMAYLVFRPEADLGKFPERFLEELE
jgi:hypothetical protein